MPVRARLPWIVAVLASFLIHAGLVAGAIALDPSLVRRLSPTALYVELPAPEPPPPAVEPPRPKEPAPPKKREMLTLPIPVETPVPKPEEARVQPEPPPSPPPPPAAQPPEPIPAPAPSTRVVEGPTAPAAATTSRSDAGPGAISWPAPGASSNRTEGNANSPGTTAATAGTNVARGTGEVTAMAHPRGGYQVRPSYPSSARRLGIEGTTLLRVFVATDGRVGDVIVQESAGHADLDRAAADAVKRWRFEPARRGADPVAIWVLLPVEFRLK